MEKSILRLNLAEDLCTHHLIIILSLADRCDWRDTRGIWHVARNPDKSWWHRQTSLKFALEAVTLNLHVIF